MQVVFLNLVGSHALLLMEICRLQAHQIKPIMPRLPRVLDLLRVTLFGFTHVLLHITLFLLKLLNALVDV